MESENEEDTCEHSDICKRNAKRGHDGKCILHSEDPGKDEETFEEAIKKHHRSHGPDFRKMVFPAGSMPFSEIEISFFAGVDREGVNCRGSTFLQQANFDDATFIGGADFSTTTFQNQVSFGSATFEGPARFSQTVFQSGADFKDTEIRGEADFRGAKFYNGEANFLAVTITGKVYFYNLELDQGLQAGGAELEGGGVFALSNLGGSDLRHITLGENATLRFRGINLSECQLVGTDLREAEFVDVKWCTEVSSDGWWFGEWFSRSGIYDEILRSDSESQVSWEEVERSYRQLKVRYEERGDFPRGGDFHIGEKVARRKSAWKNLRSEWGQWALLGVYRAFSKYGERALPAAIWLAGLLLVCAVGYLSMGGMTDSVRLTSWRLQDWVGALVLSVEATLFPVQSAGFHDIGPRALNLLQRVISPILIALFALALRQRVKR